MDFVGEEIDTKATIQGKKALNFYLPNPISSNETREKDRNFHNVLKEINTLSLIDFDKNHGTLYIGKNWGKIN